MEDNKRSLPGSPTLDSLVALEATRIQALLVVAAVAVADNSLCVLSGSMEMLRTNLRNAADQSTRLVKKLAILW